MIAGISAARRREHPERPWLWRADWSEGRIGNELRRLLIRGWWQVGAGISVASVVVALVAATSQKPHLVAAVAGVACIITLPALVAMILTTRGGAMARSTMHLDEVPVRLGGWLRGRVELEGSLQLRRELLIAVRCVNPDHSENDLERVLWEEQLSPAASPGGSRGTTSIPVAVQIPVGCPGTRMDGSCRWELLVKAPTDEGRAVSRFDLPVFG